MTIRLFKIVSGCRNLSVIKINNQLIKRNRHWVLSFFTTPNQHRFAYSALSLQYESNYRDPQMTSGHAAAHPDCQNTEEDDAGWTDLW